MRCPFCGHMDTQVKDSRPADDGASIRRRRICPSCAKRFTTVERVQLRELVVVKSDKRRVPFDRDKLNKSIGVALRKRQITEDQKEQIVSQVVRQLEAAGESEVSSSHIGEATMKALRAIDEVAFVRFASVYHDFKELEAFSKLLTEMQQRTFKGAEHDASEINVTKDIL